MKLIIGSKAPEFAIPNQLGELVELSSFLGKRVVLFFYPKDNTPGCTVESCNLRDNYATLSQKGMVLLGLSPDTAKSHQSFIAKYSLPFPLLVDADKAVMNAYGVWGEKKMYGKSYEGVFRTTFVISEDGMIEHIIEKVDTKNHAQQILELVG